MIAIIWTIHLQAVMPLDPPQKPKRPMITDHPCPGT